MLILVHYSKNLEPDLFQKYVRNYGSSYNKDENIDIFTLFDNDDFKKLIKMN